MTLTIAGKEKNCEAGKDFLPLLFSDAGRASGTAVFAGWGISAPEPGYDDYAGLDVRGKFVLCFRGTPVPDDKRFQRHDEHRERMRTACDRGALGLVYIYPEVQANPNGERLEHFMPAMISEATADLLFAAKGIQAADLKKDLQRLRRPRLLRPGCPHRAKRPGAPLCRRHRLQRRRPISPAAIRDCAANAWSLVPTWTGAAAPWDILFPGADDNASGSAVVMEVARAFQLGPAPPAHPGFCPLWRRGDGLPGSRHFAAHVPAPFARISAMFNLDMEGAGDRAFAQFSAEPPALKEAIARADGLLHILSGSGTIREVGVRSSDFAPFFLQGIPCAAFYSNGPHLGYHQAGDSIFRINPDILARITQLTMLSAWFWAERP